MTAIQRQEQIDPNLKNMHQNASIQTKTTHFVSQQAIPNQNNQSKTFQSIQKKENNSTIKRQPLKTIDYNRQGYDQISYSNNYNHYYSDNNYGYSNSDGYNSEDEEADYRERCYEHGEPIYKGDNRCYGYYECDCRRFWGKRKWLG